MADSPSLNWLSLIGNRIKVIPDSLSRAPRLRILHLIANFIEEIPDSLGNAHQLRELRLYGNPIKVIPPSLARARRLRHLELPDTIQSIPPEIFRCTISFPSLLSLPWNCWKSWASYHKWSIGSVTTAVAAAGLYVFRKYLGF